MTDDATDQRDLTLADAADRLGVSRDALRKRCDRGLVAGAFKLDGRWLIPAVSLTGRSDRPTGQDSASGRPVSHPPDMTGQAVTAAIEALVVQLAEKDRQIAALLARLDQPTPLHDERALPPGQPALAPPAAPWWRRWWRRLLGG